MGVAASAARKHFSRPLRTYNVEERAMKVISKEKPTPAPPHPSMQKIMDDIMRDPSKLKVDRADPRMLKNLSQVYITSQGENPEIKPRKMPVARAPPDELEFGYEDPKVVPQGKASLRTLIEIVANQSKDSDNYPPEQIAKEYKLDIVDVMNLKQYYKTLLVYNPTAKKEEKERNPLKRLQGGIDNLKK